MNTQYLIDTTNDYYQNDEFLNIFQTIYQQSAKEYCSLIDEISKQNSNNLYWWISITASRTSNRSSLYKDFCIVRSIEHFSSLHGTNYNFVVSSSAIKISLNQIMGPICPEITVKSYRERLNIRFKNYVRPYNFLFNKLLHLILIRFKFSKLTNNAPITLAEVFLSPTENHERYYSELQNFLDSKDVKNIFFVPTIINTNPFSIFKAIKGIRRHKKKYFFRELYLGVNDLIDAINYKKKYKNLNLSSKNKNYSNYMPCIELLANTSLNNEPFNSLSAEGILNFKFIKNLSKENNIQIFRFIDWWENTPMDKGLNLALNLFHPEVNSKGYMGFVPNKYAFQLSPSNQEIFNKVVPGNIGVIGKAFLPILNRFSETTNSFIAPAFRFEHLKNPISADRKYLLILPSIDPEESKNMIKIIFQVAELIPQLKFVIKPHPGTGKLAILNNNNKIKNIIIDEKSRANELLKNAQILITSSSSAALEGIVSLIPAIVLKDSCLIPNNIIPDFVSKESYRSFNDPESLIKAINEFKNTYTHMNVFNISKYFNLPTKHNVYNFFSTNL